MFCDLNFPFLKTVNFAKNLLSIPYNFIQTTMAAAAQYTNVDENVFSNLKSKLSDLGINLQGNSGRISEKGVNADYSFDPETKTLAISNLKVGFPASMMFNSEKIIQKISETVESSGGRLVV